MLPHNAQMQRWKIKSTTLINMHMSMWICWAVGISDIYMSRFAKQSVQSVKMNKKIYFRSCFKPSLHFYLPSLSACPLLRSQGATPSSNGPQSGNTPRSSSFISALLDTEIWGWTILPISEDLSVCHGRSSELLSPAVLRLLRRVQVGKVGKDGKADDARMDIREKFRTFSGIQRRIGCRAGNEAAHRPACASRLI